MNTINEPQFRIYWRVGANGQPHRGTGMFERKLAELWVNNLNADKDNKAVGLFYWMEAERILNVVEESAEGDGNSPPGDRASCV